MPTRDDRQGQLFGIPDPDPAPEQDLKGAPLAARMRPQSLDEFVGQEHILGPGKLLRRAIETEARKMLLQVRTGEFVVALDEHGTELTTLAFSQWMEGRMRSGVDVAFLIGGPDGFAPEVLTRADLSLSLSRLTLPHALVRVLLAEQLYRALSILSHHPYHRD